MSLFGRRQSEPDPDENQAEPTLPQHPVGFQTVLGPNTVLDGSFKCEGNVRIDGHFMGILEINGNILVGETATIEADIDARNISIAGNVQGNITGNKVQLLRTGHIVGDIVANSITTEEGAFIDGKITTRRDTAPVIEPPQDPPIEALTPPVVDEGSEKDEETGDQEPDDDKRITEPNASDDDIMDATIQSDAAASD